MRTAFFLALFSFGLMSCEISQQMVSIPPEGVEKEVCDTFAVSFPQRTKTAIRPDGAVSWNTDDRVWYISGPSSAPAPTPALAEVGLSGSSASLTFRRAESDSWYDAVYRGAHNTAPNIRTGSGSTLVFDAVKPSQDGTFADAHTCVAHAHAGDASIRFHNVTAMMVFTLGRTDIDRIVFRGAGAEPLAGEVRVDLTASPLTLVPSDSTFTEISVSLDSRTSVEDTVYFSIIPQTLGKGFSISLYDAQGVERYTASSSKPLTLTPGVITNLGNLDREISPVITVETLFSVRNWSKCDRVLEDYLGCGPGSNRGAIITFADALCSSQLEDGSWSDIDYRCHDRTNWSPLTHAGNFRDIARAWHLTRDEKYLNACRKALACWMEKRPYSDNWWFNQIGAQRVFSPSFLLLRSVLTESELAAADKILSLTTMLGMTGENALWASGIRFQRALLRGDIDLVRESYEGITSELRITTDEGIQPDYSFHQHGRMMQTGVYGLSFAHDYAWWFHAFEETTLEMSGQKREILVNFMLKSQTWLLWGGLYDLNACGRQVGKGEQANKAATVSEVLSLMGLRDNRPVGASYYPYSDFGVYRTKSWCASVRMQSIRLRGWEDTNNEDIQGYFSSDGALLVRRDGGEYKDIGACWNWKHIPGTTTYDDGRPLRGSPTLPPFNPTELVFGEAFDDVLVCAMDVVRDGLTGRKAWFFYPDGIVCLGAGITMDKGYEVTTTLEQSLAGGLRKGKNWYTHRGVTYYILDSGPVTESIGERTGKWSNVSPSYSSDPVTMSIFELTVSHGKNPHNAGYAYVISPMGLSGDNAVASVDEAVHIESNTADIQSVTIRGRTYTVNWNTGTIQ